MTKPKILLTGTTGYVGSKLLDRLRAKSLPLRCLVRKLPLSAHNDALIECIEGDANSKESLKKALDGIETAYYLIHSMGEGKDFAARDRKAAHLFGQAASEMEVKRIIYLGGLGDDSNPKLSGHLKSRHEVGAILRSYPTEVIEFRSSIIIGKGSFAFEMIKTLVERLPVMVLPRWVNMHTQPIGIDDLLSYLELALDLPQGPSQIIEIGGKDQVTYRELMETYAKEKGYKRMMLPVPVLTPFLSALWLALVTPFHFKIGRILVESLQSNTIVKDTKANRLFPISPMGTSEAIYKALQ
jgi:uncharacterized protein YbjT (DUF2867 family)